MIIGACRLSTSGISAPYDSAKLEFEKPYHLRQTCGNEVSVAPWVGIVGLEVKCVVRPVEPAHASAPANAYLRRVRSERMRLPRDMCEPAEVAHIGDDGGVMLDHMLDDDAVVVRRSDVLWRVAPGYLVVATSTTRYTRQRSGTGDLAAIERPSRSAG